jgi:hypothetical protein
MMTRNESGRLLLGLILVGVVSAGCSTLSNRVDAVASGELQAEGALSPLVEISQPKVMRNDNTLEIEGTITRKPGVDGPIPGYLLLQVLSPDGEVLDSLALSWVPKDIPTTGERQSRYGIRWLLTPPQGSLMRVGLSEDMLVDSNGWGRGTSSDLSNVVASGRTPPQPNGRPGQPNSHPNQPSQPSR